MRNSRDPLDLMIVELTGEEIVDVETPSDDETVYRSATGVAHVIERCEDNTIVLEVRTWMGTLVGQVEYHDDGHFEAVYV